MDCVCRIAPLNCQVKFRVPRSLGGVRTSCSSCLMDFSSATITQSPFIILVTSDKSRNSIQTLHSLTTTRFIIHPSIRRPRWGLGRGHHVEHSSQSDKRSRVYPRFDVHQQSVERGLKQLREKCTAQHGIIIIRIRI